MARRFHCPPGLQALDLLAQPLGSLDLTFLSVLGCLGRTFSTPVSFYRDASKENAAAEEPPRHILLEATHSLPIKSRNDLARAPLDSAMAPPTRAAPAASGFLVR